MIDDPAHIRRQRDDLIRERRRGLWRTVAGMVIVSAILALVIAGILTWIGRS